MRYVIRYIWIFTDHVSCKIPHSKRRTLFETFHLSFQHFQGVLNIKVRKVLCDSFVFTQHNCSRRRTSKVRTNIRTKAHTLCSAICRRNRISHRSPKSVRNRCSNRSTSTISQSLCSSFSNRFDRSFSERFGCATIPAFAIVNVGPDIHTKFIWPNRYSCRSSTAN